ncbi:hypothetical protein UFOVP456_50 [uncultured Caudovirales phage]|jgi:hypothetical protein|uniref:Uncharacterized protein n=1 Tax=uncultured Caudovirales phage TaxID=2100421 RepID=A0A6J5ME80_9CAUD|nr:hypothetical protein UFOVP456_50 [uncultured Caudovirales phage]
MPLTQIPTGMFEDNSVTSAKLSADLRNQTPAFKNRIINGDMRIDQRNAGASVTPTTSAQAFAVDRTSTIVSQNSKLTVQQNAGSVTPPAGFTNYLGATSSSAYSVLTSDYFNFNQTIEGFNIADLGWGTANAQTVTLSFWIRSSLTGTHSGSLRNGAANRSYVFSFSVSSANTWEQKTITIAGDTSGTWQTGNGAGMFVSFNLGAGSTFATTAGAWVAGNFIGATGSVNVVGTNGATFYITGVQLEKGSTATSFDYRPYGTELQLCQRYFEKSVNIDTAIFTNTIATFYGNMQSSISNGSWYLTIPYKVTKRAAPTVVTYPFTTATNGGRFSNNGGIDYGANSAAAGGIYDSQFSIQNNSGGALAVGAGIVFGSWFASAEL